MGEKQHQGSSEKKKINRRRAWRINLFFFAVFSLFAGLVIKLGILQIVNGEDYKKQANRTEIKTASYPSPRGKMYDSRGRVVVDNESVPAIVYTSESGVKAKDKIKVARQLATYIKMDTDFLRERDIRDYWLANNTKQADKLVTKTEIKNQKLGASEIYALQVERVPDEEIKAIENDATEKAVAAIYRRFTGGYAFEPQIVKAMNPNEEKKGDDKVALLDETKESKQTSAVSLTYDEISLVSEHLDELPGVNVINDWTRKYPYKNTLYNVLGGVTTPEQGIIKEREDYYLARGYSRNDRVGKSYLEYQYEDFLNSEKATVQYTQMGGKLLDEVKRTEGRRGLDLALTFDMELQKEVDEIVESELKAASARNYMMDRAFVVMMNPNTGDILAMSGKKMEGRDVTDYAIGTFTTQYEVGSVVKGATVLAGYQDGMSHGQGYVDTPLYFAGNGKPKKSYMDLGWVNDLRALQKSSNVYMFQVAMRIANITYQKNGSLPADTEDLQKLRNYYAQFGLGVKTGIDLPQESSGMQTHPKTVGGLLLDEVIGQYDTYTPLQVAQYMSTIANGGNRVQPRVVQGIHMPTNKDEIGPVIKKNEPKILNRINNSTADIDRVKMGLKMVTSTGGTAAGRFGKHDVAGKTGTAQTFYYGANRNWWGNATYNLTFAGYYPSSNPEVAFSVVTPYVSDKDKVIHNIPRRIVDKYVELQEKYNKQ
ncbi:peptidoglycan D,D-transpeptidase FtsI family protein [Bacillus sp. NPDC077027]|uniref:peptidoglycan D,D-transpeptidase FtsI family protein n=1 Tax=Bacillus sp. NPDC077027 TaxID=3390548 RepID=UPI003D03A240